MEFILLLIVIAVVLFCLPDQEGGEAGKSDRQMFTFGSPQSGHAKASRHTRQTASISNQELKNQWLAERWAMADRPESERPEIFPYWYFDPVTERQLERLEEEGIKVPLNITKGKASDLIGLSQSIDYKDEKVLKFFKRSTRGVSQTQGRHEAALILSDPDNKSAWEGKPPDTMQREFFQWFGIPLPRGTTSDQAKDRISEAIERIEESEIEYWDLFEFWVSELDDPELRKDYEIKKVPLKVIREAIIALRSEGLAAAELEGDLELVIEKILDIRPDLMRG